MRVREPRADNLPLTQLERHWPTPPAAVPHTHTRGTLGEVEGDEGRVDPKAVNRWLINNLKPDWKELRWSCEINRKLARITDSEC